MTRSWTIPIGSLSLALLLAVAACHEPFSNDDLIFLKSLPRNLSVDVPGQESTQQSRGLRAEQTRPPVLAKFYTEASSAATSLNAGLLAVPDLVDEIARYEPSIREDNLRLWGPLPVQGGEIRLVIDERDLGAAGTSTIVQFTKTSTPTEIFTVYNYAFQLRATDPLVRGILEASKLTDREGWANVFFGQFAPADVHGGGQGWFAVVSSVVKLVDPKTPFTGLWFVRYDTRHAQETIEVVADILVDIAKPFDPPELYYYYQRAPSGDGHFEFASYGQLVPGLALEVMQIYVRWLADGHGLAIVAITEGDVMRSTGQPGIIAFECWNTEFLQTYLRSNLPLPELAPFGSPADCAPALRSDDLPN